MTIRFFGFTISISLTACSEFRLKDCADLQQLLASEQALSSAC
jgi:hypothetical protein